MTKIELGTIEFSAEFENSELKPGGFRIDFLQDNLKEIAKLVPDGNYSWVLTLDLDRALTIGQMKERGFILCPKCRARRVVDNEFNVKPCESCGDAPEYWNLMVQTHRRLPCS